jgi:SAM-dependent methyltransferase
MVEAEKMGAAAEAPTELQAAALALVERCAAGDLSPAIALVRLLVLGGDVAAVRSALAGFSADQGLGRDLGPALAELRVLLDSGGDLVARILAQERRSDARLEHRLTREAAADELARCARLFDQAVRESPEASVALYSLGCPARLEAATAEVVALLDRLSVLGGERRVLEIGCGIGRFLQALSGRAAALTGIDIAPGMIAEARRRCAGLPNLRLLRTSGRNLAAFGAAAFETVLAIDSLPYVHRAGMALLESHFREVARVLVDGGDFVVLNLTYRGDLALDRADARRLALASGFDLLSNGTQELELWDGAIFHLRKSKAGHLRKPNAGAAGEALS